MASALTKALGQEVHHNDVSHDAYRGMGFPGADELGNMFQFFHDFNDDFRGARDTENARNLNPSLQSFDRWLDQNKDQIPME